MMNVPGLKLGDCSNLIMGFKPLWDRGDVSAKPFFTPQQNSTVTFDTEIQQSITGWSFPIVSIHDDTDSLINKLYDYKVLPGDGQAVSFSIQSGALMVKDADSADSFNSLKDYLGVDLTTDNAYMLVRMVRNDGEAVHEIVSSFGTKHREDYLTQSAKDAFLSFSSSLPDDLDTSTLQGLSLEQSQALLNLFYEYGTHFVSKIKVGDVFFQVFAMEKSAYASLKKAFTSESGGSGEVSGLEALNYIYYTTPYHVNSGHAYGFVSQYGNILSEGNDPMLQSTLASGAWIDNKYSQRDSIFMAYDSSKTETNFLGNFNVVVPVGFELLPITAFLTDNSLIALWTRLFNGAMLQKYGLSITVAFGATSGYNWDNVFQSSSDSWLSTIATPNIDIYQEYLDVSDISLINQDQVVNFSIFTQVLEMNAEKNLVLPGKNISILAYTVDTTGSTQIPVLELSGDAFSSHTFSCGKMFGAAIIQSSEIDKHYSLVDGLCLKAENIFEATGRLLVEISEDRKTAPEIAVLQKSSQSLNFSLVAAQSELSSRAANADQVKKFENEYLNWVVNIIPDTCEDAELLNIRTQAQYLSKISGNFQGEGIEVQYLTYETYEDYVNSMITLATQLTDNMRNCQMAIEAQKQAELTVKTAQELNENIKATGKLLTDYFAALSENQTDMSGFYSTIVAQKKKEFDDGITDIQELNKLVEEQQEVVDDAVEAFKEAIKEWETEEVFKFCLQIATDVFKVATCFIIPESSIADVAEMGETAEKIQEAMEVIDFLAELGEKIENDIKSLQGITQALSMLDSDFEMPSAYEWAEFSVEFKNSLQGVPNKPGPQTAKNNLIAAFEVLVIRAQAWIEAKARLCQITTDLYYSQRLQKINKDQAERMDDLSKSLHMNDISDPEVASIDLIGMTGEIQFQMKQIMSMLANTLVMQDAAIQYEYLGEPTSITTFDLLNLEKVMVSQKSQIINALNNMNPPPLPVDDPIIYRINGIPVHELTNGNIYEFTIQPSSTEFIRYSMVRVDKVVANIIGISGSNSGEYLIDLTYKGDPFVDRDKERTLITFNTNQRKFGPFDYRISDGKCIYGDKTGPIDETITKITPFSTWQIALPDSSTNKDLTFTGATVDIELNFNITALLVDPESTLMTNNHKALPMVGDASSQTTLDSLLDQMYTSGAVLKGWDVVFNLLEEPVNRFLEDQYNTQQKGEPMTISAGSCQKFPNPVKTPLPYIAAYTKYNFQVGPPLMQFETNNSDYVTVKQNILSGYIQTGSEYVDASFNPVTDCNINDPGITWDDPQTIDIGQNPYIQGTVALATVDGLVNDTNGDTNTKSVILDFTKGSFTAQNLNISVDDTDIREALETYFTTSDIQYIVNSLDLTNIATLDAMKPKSFKLNVMTTNSNKNVLQMFITTNGTAQNNLTINVNEPIPDDYDCSLMINTKIMFNDIFVQSFNKNSKGITVEVVNPGNDYTAWNAKVTSGSVTGEVDFGNADDQYKMNKDGSNDITWPITGMIFKPSKNQGVDFKYNDEETVDFYYRTKTYMTIIEKDYYGDWEKYSVDATFDMTGNYPISVNGQDRNQTIQISSTPPSVDVSNTTLKPTGACECNDDTLKLTVIDEMQDQIPASIQSQMAGITFDAISIFALENLLFPAENFIQMNRAFVPGDLLIVGHFLKFKD